jgi:ribonuclease P protein component
MKLFTEGKSFSFPPFRVVLRSTELKEEIPLKVLFSVSKRNFKRAVHRNRIRRLMREAWRRNRQPLWDQVSEKKITLHIALVYTSTKMPDFDNLESKIIKLIHRLTSANEALD